MNREIKFRGNAINPFDNWVYGSLWIIKDNGTEKTEYVIQGDGTRCRVIPESVGQYTGLKDKNGKEIYEGDILNGRNRVLKIVYWCDKRSAFCESEQFKPKPAKCSFAKLYDKFGKIFNKNGVLENHYVVGNIYENPELIKKQK